MRMAFSNTDSTGGAKACKVWQFQGMARAVKNPLQRIATVRMSVESPTKEHADHMKALAREEFESWAGSYDRSLLHVFLFRPSYRVLTEEIANWHDEHQRPMRVLDIGCGTGELASILSLGDWPIEVVGLDYSPAMCEVASKKFEMSDAPHRVRFTAADSEFLPFADNTFDVVTCSNSFHHYPHQGAVVRNIHRILKPQGRFVLIDGFRDNVVGWVTFDVVIAHIEKNVHHAPWSQIDGYFRDADFANIRRRKFNFWMPLCATIGEKL